MSNVAIKVENLGKLYRLGEIGTGTLSHDLNRFWARLRGKEDPFAKIGEANDRTTKGNSDFVWSLKDVNFDVKQGEVLGIIGRNGAGKSTLLKILSKVTAPTTGRVKVRGRIASLLEVGTGFHPELTGRENIYLNGAILGMTKSEISSKFDEIVDFSGVERYIDTPVKRYSSGMYVRLAFAVAAFLEPEILIVDEVLAVGDAEFQKKCLGRMKDVSVNDGRTVLFVSHNMDAISRLCNSAVYLKNGAVELKGSIDHVINEYMASEIKTTSFKSWLPAEAPGNDNVKLISARVINQTSEESFNIDIRQKVGLEIVFEVLKESNNYIAGINLYDKNDLHILSSHNYLDYKKVYSKGLHKSIAWVPGNFLSEGTYKASVAVMSYEPFIVHFHPLDAVSFNVFDVLEGDSVRGNYGGVFPGIVRPKLEWS